MSTLSAKIPKPAIGVIILKVLSNNTSAINYGNTTETRIKRGQVVAVGEQGWEERKYKVPVMCKKDDVVWFLKYEMGYDKAVINGEEYLFIAMKDLRGVE